jgi:hypothetical protein
MSRTHYSGHLDRLTIAVHSPFWARTHQGRDVMITPQQYRLVARVLPGWRGNQRELAGSLGYSIAGLNEAISTLTKLGILARLSHRGRRGWTRLVMVVGVHLANVRERSTDVLRTLSERLSMYRTFPGGASEAPPRLPLPLPDPGSPGVSGVWGS